MSLIAEASSDHDLEFASGWVTCSWKVSRVIAMANTPSLRASGRPMSRSSGVAAPSRPLALSSTEPPLMTRQPT